MIKTIVFDLGGVIVTISQEQAVERFREIGLKDAGKHLDPYTQKGIFGDLEEGLITEEQFRDELSKLCGKEVTMDECLYAWTGYAKEVPTRNLRKLEELRQRGYRVLLLSNTNPFMQKWANGDNFSELGKPLYSYFDEHYVSYEMRMMKPSEEIFRTLLMKEKVLPQDVLFVDDGARNVAAASELGIHTFRPVNGEDWTEEIEKYL